MKVFIDHNIHMFVVQIGTVQFLFWFFGFGIDKKIDFVTDSKCLSWKNIFRLGN